jgi:ATP-dependent DNA ligase
VLKKTRSTYRPGKLGWIKVKARQTAEYIIAGITGSLTRPGSLLLGRYDRHGVLRYLTQTHPLRANQRAEVAGIRPMTFQGLGSGHAWPCPLPGAWSVDLTSRDPVLYLQVEPTLVAEIETDIAADGVFGKPRHRSTFLRTRPDLHPDEITKL